jgi:hypothetical protein
MLCDGKAAFYKKLFVETRKQYPEMKLFMEPYVPWIDYLSDITIRPDVSALKPDILCEEKDTLEFVSDGRIFTNNLMTKDKMCSSTPNEFSHTGNLGIAGNAAINGAWFLWYGRLGGTGNFPRHDSIKTIPPRLKLIRAMPGWDNLNSVPLSSRKWDGTKLEYSSSLSFANQNIIYSTHPKNKKLYVVVLNKATGVNLKGKSVESIYLADELFLPKSNATADFSNVNGTLYLKSDANLGKGYIITLKESSTNTPIIPLTPPKSQASCADTDGGNNIFVKGTISGLNSAGSSYSFTDVCLSDTALRENYCMENVATGINLNCSSGCKNGACVLDSGSGINDTNTNVPPINASGGNSSLSDNQSSSDGLSDSNERGLITSGGSSGSTKKSSLKSTSSSSVSNSSVQVTQTNIITEYCGDKMCKLEKENCSSCLQDCGPCPETEVNSIQNLHNQETQIGSLNEPKEMSGVFKSNESVQQHLTGQVSRITEKKEKKSTLSFILIFFVVSSLVAFLYYRSNNEPKNQLNSISTFTDFSAIYPSHAKEVKEYIKQAKKAGHSEYLIKYNMVNAGWPEHIVISAIHSGKQAS